MAETVTVTGDAVMVDTSSSASAVNVDKTFFDLIPKGRGFYDLINLAPGARNESKTGGYQVDGASGSENTYYLDGMEVTNVQTGVLSTQNRIPVEAVQQVQVKNGVMDAQYGGAMGGVVNAVIRSGTNEFHGQAGFYFNNDAMSARLRPTLEMDPTDADPHASYRYFQNKMDDYSDLEPGVQHRRPDPEEQAVLLHRLHADQDHHQPHRDVPVQQLRRARINQKDSPALRRQQAGLCPDHQDPHEHELDLEPELYQQGTCRRARARTSPNRDWAELGSYTAGNILSGQMDYIATNKLLFSFRGGYHFTQLQERLRASPA